MRTWTCLGGKFVKAGMKAWSIALLESLLKATNPVADPEIKKGEAHAEFFKNARTAKSGLSVFGNRTVRRQTRDACDGHQS